MLTNILRLTCTVLGVLCIVFSIEYFIIDCMPILGLTLYTLGLVSFSIGAKGILRGVNDHET